MHIIEGKWEIKLENETIKNILYISHDKTMATVLKHAYNQNKKN